MTSRTGGERGQVTAFVTIMTVAILFVVGLVLDGLLLRAKRETVNLADGAARAGAQALDIDALRSGRPRLDQDEARALVGAYLDRFDEQADSVSFPDAVTIEVTVSRSQRLRILGLTRTVEAVGAATNQRGVVSAGDV